MNNFDLNAAIDTAAQLFNSLFPIFTVLVGMMVITSLWKLIHDFTQETSALQVGRMNQHEKPKNQPPADPDAMPEPYEKPKNGPPSLNDAVALGDDGELIYEDELIVGEEPRYMRRLW